MKLITSYREISWVGVRNGDQFSQELQLTCQSEMLSGVVGVYFFAQGSDDILTVELNPPPGIQRDSDNNEIDNGSWAVFTQWTYHPSEQLDLTAGARCTEHDKASRPDQYDLANPAVRQIPVHWYSDTLSSLTPSASIAYRWNDDAMTCFSYAQGCKGGGWNGRFKKPQRWNSASSSTCSTTPCA